MIGQPLEGDIKWELGLNKKMGTVFLNTEEQDVDAIYAVIRNDPVWELSDPAVKAFIYHYDTDQLIAVSEAIYPISRTYTLYAWSIPTTHLTLNTRYLLGLIVGNYGAIDWKYFTVTDIMSFKAEDNYTAGPSQNWGTNIETLYKQFTIYATFGMAPSSPTAVLTYSPTTPMTNTATILDASMSKNGWNGTDVSPIVRYIFQIDTETYEQNTPILKTIFETSGEYTITLTVEDQQGLTSSASILIMVIPQSVFYTITTKFEDDWDYQFGIENEPRYIIYSQPNDIILGPPKIWTYGGWTNIDMVNRGLATNFFEWNKFEPENYNTIPAPPMAEPGTRCAKQELVRPQDYQINDDFRRQEIFRIHDPTVPQKELEAWIYLPTDFNPDDWCVLTRPTREIIFGAFPPYPPNAFLNITIGISNDYKGSDLDTFKITVPVNHFSQFSDWEYNRYDVQSVETVKLGEWFNIKSYIFRHRKLGKIKVWLRKSEAENWLRIISVEGTDANPVCTMYIDSDTFAALPTYNPGGGAPYGFVASGINLYKGGITLHPCAAYFKTVNMTYYSSVPTLISPLVIPLAGVATMGFILWYMLK